jgi:hypothetical protein
LISNSLISLFDVCLIPNTGLINISLNQTEFIGFMADLSQLNIESSPWNSKEDNKEIVVLSHEYVV